MPAYSISIISRSSTAKALLCLASAAFASANLTAQISEAPMPPDAPRTNCEISPSTDPSTLRTLSAPATFVFACQRSQDHPACYADQVTGELKDSTAKRLIATGETMGSWTCAFYDDVPGWLPTSALAPLPDHPSPSLRSWIGFYRRGTPTAKVEQDRLLIQPGKAAGTLHVSGRAYWHGLNDNVHFGGINADATPIGPYLHIVDGNGAGACVLDLVLDASKRTLSADDNTNCGGMNVRFWGLWNRFTPSTRQTK